jgi:hypothetical protein
MTERDRAVVADRLVLCYAPLKEAVARPGP